MTLAPRHGILFLLPAALLVSLGACDGNPATSTLGGGGSTTESTGAPGGGGEGGLFQTNVGGSTSSATTTTSSTTTKDPSDPCLSASPTSPSTTWAKKAGGAQVQSVLGVDADAQSNVVVVGNYRGTIDWGAGPLTSVGLNDAYVAKLDANGTALWSKSYGDAGYHQYAQHVATDAQGNILVTGHFRGSINFGGGALNDISNFFEDLFIAKLGPTGAHVWSKRYGDINNEESQAIAIDALDNVLVVGAFQKTIDFGGGAIIAEDGGFNGFVAKLGSAGNQLWAKSLGDTASEQKTIGVTTDGAGNVYIVGYHQGSIDLGAGSMAAAAGEQNAYVAKLSSGGAFTWAKSWPSVGATAVDVAVDAAGNVYVLGNFKGKASFGGAEFDAGVANDVFLVKLDSAGNHVWSKAFGDPTGADEATSIALDGDAIVLFGAFMTKIDFGGGALTSSGGFDAFYAKLDKDGCEIQAAAFGDSVLQRGETLAIDPAGNTLFGGSFDGTVDFGAGALSAEDTDAYVVKLKP
jgi:hypothetical protein